MPMLCVILAFAWTGCSGSSRQLVHVPSRARMGLVRPGAAARLDDGLARWAADVGVHGAAATVVTPGWLDWRAPRG